MSVFGLVRKCRGFIWCANVGVLFGAQMSGFGLVRKCRVSVWCANVGVHLVRKCRVFVWCANVWCGNVGCGNVGAPIKYNIIYQIINTYKTNIIKYK